MTITSGEIIGGTHVLPIRIYYEDTDVGGIVYYANYLKFAERARTEMLRLAGFEQDKLFADYGVGFAVRNCEIDYRLPARLDDLLEVHSRMLELKAASLRTEQIIRRGGDDLVRLKLRVACMKLDGRPTRIPAPIFEALENMTAQE